MSLKKTLAGVVPFAHLLSNSHAAKAEENERDQRDGESDDDYAKRMEELDEKEEEARRAEEERKEEEARRAAAEDGDDDGDDESDDAKKAARATERARCARIMAHGIALGAPAQAGVFAFDTKMSSKAAIAALDAGHAVAPQAAPRAARRASLDDRMANTRVPNPGASSSAAAEPSIAEQIVMAGKKRRGEA